MNNLLDLCAENFECNRDYLELISFFFRIDFGHQAVVSVSVRYGLSKVL